MQILITVPMGTDRTEVIRGLEARGHRVAVCDDPSRTIDRIESTRPDAVVLDAPDGEAVAGWIKDHTEFYSTVTILLVDRDRFEGDERLDRIGADDVALTSAGAGELAMRIERHRRAAIPNVLADAGATRIDVQEAVDRFIMRHRDREEEVLALFLTDPDTGLHNRAYFKTKMSEEIKRADRHDVPLSAVLIKLATADGGRLTPMTSKEIASVLLLESRDIDVVGRYDDCDFSLLLPNTPVDGAVQVAQRIGERIATREFTDHAPGEVRVRVGVATFPMDGVRRAGDLIERAQRALLQAETYGRPEICIWEATAK